MEMALIPGMMDKSTQESGKMIKDMVSLFLLGLNLRGKCKLVYENGDIFEGVFEEDKRKEGKFIFTNGIIDEGTWIDDKQHG